MPTITEIENAIINELNTQLTYLQTCKSLGEALTHDAADLAVQVPAAYVVYEGGRYDHVMSGTQDRWMNFAVIVVAKNLRGEEEARRGQGTTKGAYDLLDDARATLSNNAVGLTIDPLLPVDETAIENTEKSAAYAIRFATRTRYTL
ncbi:MAG: Gp37 family protein [Thermodesulfobacteriota bacterium]|jgi:phage gp37-like protein|nr:MAG: Gp37 family protein [Thermodesulfobacteriota bacterium]